MPARANHKTFANGSKHHRSCLAHASKFFLLYERPSPKNISQWSGVSGILDNDGAGDDEGPVAHEP